MSSKAIETSSAMTLLKRMFDAELAFLRSREPDVSALAEAFHPAVVIHEPASLPYAGDWEGLDGVGSLFRQMSNLWSDVGVSSISAVKEGDMVFMSCRLRLVCRANGAVVEQPFAEALRFRDDRLIDGTPFYFDTAALTEILTASAPTD